jgi:hypothetical protein
MWSGKSNYRIAQSEWQRIISSDRSLHISLEAFLLSDLVVGNSVRLVIHSDSSSMIG